MHTSRFDLFFLILITTFFAACAGSGADSTSDSQPTENQESTETHTSETKTPETPAASEEIPEEVEMKTYLLNDTLAGEFYPGAMIPLWEGAETAYTLKKESKMTMQEGMEMEEVKYLASRDGELHLELVPQFDMRVNKFNEIVSEVIVLSPAYQTSEGIGVGSTVEEFFDAYPNAVVNYTYVSDRFWLSYDDAGPQFFLDGEDFLGTKDYSSDWVTDIPASDFKPGSKIQKVRIIGRW